MSSLTVEIMNGGIPMSLIQKEIADFSVQCYQNNAFRTATKADVLGKWSVFFFYPADFTFVCPRSWRTWQTSTINSRPSAAKFTPFPAIPTLSHKAWHDASERIQKIQYPMLLIPQHCLAKDFEVYIEADGVAERGSFIVNPEGKIVAYESTPAMWAGTPTSCCGRCRPASSWRSTETRCARRSGSPAPRP